MKIVLTGSLGHISKPLAAELLAKGHTVTVISSKEERRKEIEGLGGKAAIGSVEDQKFLTDTMRGADSVYCMFPPNFSQPDQILYYEKLGKTYERAILDSGVKRVVDLSSYGAHLPSGTGFITGSYRIEQILNLIPDIRLTHVRPTYFYYNLLSFIGMIQQVGFIGSVYGGEDELPMVSPNDIAAVVAQELTDTEFPKPIRYVSSDDRTCKEVAQVLGKAIGVPDLEWLILPKEQVKQALLNSGVPNNAADNLIELGEAIHSGKLREEYSVNKPVLGKVKLDDYAKEFAFHYKRDRVS